MKSLRNNLCFINKNSCDGLQGVHFWLKRVRFRVFYKSQRNTTHMTFETALLSSGYVYDAQPGVYMKEEQNGVLHTYMHIDGDVWNYEKYDENDDILMTKKFTL